MEWWEADFPLCKPNYDLQLLQSPYFQQQSI